MNNHNKHYRQLTQEQRYQISGLRKAGMTMRAIAESVGVHYSTVSPEIKRNATTDGYHPMIAHQLSNDRKKSAFKANNCTEKTDKIRRELLAPGWSPEAISQ